MLSLLTPFFQTNHNTFWWMDVRVNWLRDESTLKSILFVIRTIVLKLYAQVYFCICYCIFLVFLTCFLIINKNW